MVCAAAAAACLFRSRPGLPRAPHRPAPVGPGARARPHRPLAAAAAGVTTALLVGHVAGLLLAPVACAAAWRWAGSLEWRAVLRRREALVRQLPLVVDLMAGCLAVGASPEEALARVAAAVDAPMREELLTVVARLRLGADPVTVWGELSGHTGLGPLGRTLARAVRTGASVAEAMARLAEDLRRTSRTEVESRARSVAVKAAAPLGLCLLPAFVLVGVVPLVAGAVSRFLSP